MQLICPRETLGGYVPRRRYGLLAYGLRDGDHRNALGGTGDCSSERGGKGEVEGDANGQGSGPGRRPEFNGAEEGSFEQSRGEGRSFMESDTVDVRCDKMIK